MQRPASRRRLICYTRVSSDRQVEEGMSLDAQEHKLRGWCEVMGHDVVTVVQDAAVSGTVTPEDRPGWKEVVRLLQAEEAEGVVFTRIDRLSRSVVHILGLLDRFQKKGWLTISLAESIDTTTPMGRCVVTMLSAFAELERGNIMVRTAEGRAEAKRQGRKYSAIIPYGKEADPDKPGYIRDCAVEIEVMNRVADMIRAQVRNPVVIAGRLNEWHPQPRTGKPWDFNAVNRIFAIMKRLGRKPDVKVIRPELKGKKVGVKKVVASVQ